MREKNYKNASTQFTYDLLKKENITSLIKYKYKNKGCNKDQEIENQ